MPRNTDIKNLTPEKALQQIRKSAKTAVKQGRLCLDKTALKAKLGYTDEQADVYISTFNKNVGTPEEQALKKARKAAVDAVAHGRACPTEEYLKKRMKYTAEQVKVYLEKYKELERSKEQQALRKARKSAQGTASLGHSCYSDEALKKKGYSEKEIEAYQAAYKQSESTQEEQAKRLTRGHARTSAYHARACASEEALKKAGYTDEQITIYLATYEAAKGTEQEQALRKARYDAQEQAYRCRPLPTEEKLKEKGYSEEQITAFLQSYQMTLDKKVQKLLTKVREAMSKEEINPNDDSEKRIAKRSRAVFDDSEDRMVNDEEASLLLFSSCKHNTPSDTSCTQAAEHSSPSKRRLA
ncbi:hypothetical protein [Candidatus Berkiella aquae]|uniref:Uncharacterized protein n=1 Tax=Candidatus Berkiella aquae TaxID=295108 RepID=A0A0Q9YMI0_9GAMM|nr:hypothetical protein [Candidatus Berkiella aquae]MCS5709922.1 hypothetical protein [Candidatus Berkiella aquae]